MRTAKHRTLAQVMTEEIGNTLVGGTITNAILSTDCEEYGFKVKCRDGKTRLVWVMSDEEGKRKEPDDPHQGTGRQDALR